MIEGQTADQVAKNPASNFEAISPGYFATMGIPVVAGRDFNSADQDGAPLV